LKFSSEILDEIRATALGGTDSQLQETLEKAMEEANAKKNWHQEVKEWVVVTTGYFSVTSCYFELQAVTKQEKGAVRIALMRLKGEGMIEPHPTKNGFYRKIERECELINWQDAPTEEVSLRFPLGIEEFVKIYPKSIIMIAGKSDAGKSGFLLEFARLNMDRHEVHLFINEAGDSELAVRLGLFRGVKKEDWKCTFWEREDGFADVIKPNAINIIDYLDVTKDFAEIGTPIKQIHNKLEKGIALIAIQKNPKQYNFKTGKYIDIDFGIGGAKSVGKSRLYLSIDDGIIKIVKAKNRRGKESPNGMTRTFKIYDGHDFADVGLWRKPQEW